MVDFYKNKYRIKSARLDSWDYRWNAAYFITICTARRRHYFGEIKQGKMHFSPVGVIADILWHEIPHHASGVELGNFILMPNHIHGILILDNSEIPKEENISEGKDKEGKIEDRIDPKDDSPGNYPQDDSVQTLHATSPQPPQSPQHPGPIPQPPQKNFQMAKISPRSNSISTIIRSYKSATTKHAHRLGYEFEWQTRFYDIIIRDDRTFQNISNYIKNNPANWKEDKFH